MVEIYQNGYLLLSPQVGLKRPVNLIGCDTVEGIDYFFDGNAVEYYITGSVSEEDMVELHFASGNVIEVLSALDENLYPGENVETLVDDCICRYLTDKN